MSLSAKRRGRALRSLLLTDVRFSRGQVDRMARGDAFLASCVRFMGCDDERDEIVTWSMRGHSGPGVYVECSEYPEEGTAFAGLSYGEAMRLAGSP